MRNLRYGDHVKVIDCSGKSLILPGLFCEGSIAESKLHNLLVHDKDINTCIFAGSVYEYLQNKIMLCEMNSYRTGMGSVLTKRSMLNLNNLCLDDEVARRLGCYVDYVKLIMRGWIGGDVNTSYRIKIFQGSIKELKEFVKSDEFNTAVNHLMVN